jgi:hypothetical protein
MTAAGCNFSLFVAMLFSGLPLSAGGGNVVFRSSQSSTAPSSSSAKPAEKKYTHQNEFLIHGTVFNEKALSFAGVPLKIRRVGDKKFHWKTNTNSRGEFAVRVPQGTEYELVVHLKGFTEQTRTVNAKDAGTDEVLVFRMTPQRGVKQ